MESVGRGATAGWMLMTRPGEWEKRPSKDSPGEAISRDAKSLRGSHRELPALSIVRGSSCSFKKSSGALINNRGNRS